MNFFDGMVTGFSKSLDRIAGLCLTIVMLMVVANILMRAIFNHPILGTFELVGFFTALGVALALARCALENSHIAVDFLVERLPLRIKAGVEVLINLIGFSFWSMCAWHLCIYASNKMASGVVSSTAQIPVYPFIFLVSLGVLGLCLVLLLKFIQTFRTAAAGLPVAKILCFDKSTDSVGRVCR